MKKIGVLILSIVIVSSLLVGCGGKKEVSKTTDSKKVTQTQNQITDNKNSSTNNGTSNSTTNSSSNSTAGSNSTSGSSTAAGQATISQLQKEEKEINSQNRAITDSDVKKYPMFATSEYLNNKYREEFYVGEITDKDTHILSDKEIKYNCTLEGIKDGSEVFRDITVQLSGSEWKVINDELIKTIK